MLKCFNILKILQLELYLLIWCRAGETLTDQLTDLGQNVTINCDFDVQEVSWLLLKLPDSPVLILRTFSTPPPHYYNNRFIHKYLVQHKPHLFINNVTINELGLYYCVTTDTPPKYSNGTRLYITEPTAETQNQTQWQTLTLIFGVLNGILIIVIIGLLKVFVYGSKRTRDRPKRFQNTNLQQPQLTDLQQPQDPSQVQYTAVDLPTPCQRFQFSQVNSTYALLELPKSTAHNHK